MKMTSTFDIPSGISALSGIQMLADAVTGSQPVRMGSPRPDSFASCESCGAPPENNWKCAYCGRARGPKPVEFCGNWASRAPRMHANLQTSYSDAP